jgi:hypothetical protein
MEAPVLWTLIVVACLAHAPDYCERIERQVEGCLAQGPALVALLSQERPELVVRRWACRPGDAA